MPAKLQATGIINRSPAALDADLDKNVFWTWITIFDLVPRGGYFGCWSTRDDGKIINAKINIQCHIEHKTNTFKA